MTDHDTEDFSKLRVAIATMPIGDHEKRQWLRIIAYVEGAPERAKEAAAIREQARKNNMHALWQLIASIAALTAIVVVEVMK